MEKMPVQPKRSTTTGRSPDRTVDLQGHRGARGKRPENTIPAFTYCIESRMTTIELDTNVTRDKQLIVYHDTALNGRICLSENGRPAKAIPIRDLTVAQLKRLDGGALANADFPEQLPVAGTRLVTLAEVFEFVSAYERDHVLSHKIRFNIETKFRKECTQQEIQEAARLVVEAIEAAGMDHRTTVQSFVADVLPEVRKLNRRIQTAFLTEPGTLRRGLLKLGLLGDCRKIIARALVLRVDILSPHYLYVDALFVHRCHEKKLKVLVWVVNDEKMMQTMLACGVDGIISDYPDRLYRVYSAWRKETT